MDCSGSPGASPSLMKWTPKNASGNCNPGKCQIFAVESETVDSRRCGCSGCLVVSAGLGIWLSNASCSQHDSKLNSDNKPNCGSHCRACRSALSGNFPVCGVPFPPNQRLVPTRASASKLYLISLPCPPERREKYSVPGEWNQTLGWCALSGRFLKGKASISRP
jgi:hypothetical protein